MTETKTRGCLLLDFTGQLPGGKHIERFDDDLVTAIRLSGKGATIVVLDYAVGRQPKTPTLVRDHLNLSAGNPLVGPNHPCGERFPVVQNIYVEDCLNDLPRAIVAGVKHGIVPTGADEALLATLGADYACYNLVPTMLVAAHAQVRVIGILCPQGESLPEQLIEALATVTGAGQ